MKKCISKVLFIIRNINFITIKFNLTYFNLDQAVKLPVFVSTRFTSIHMKGSVKIEGKIRTGMVTIGHGKVGIVDYKNTNVVWDVKGEVIFKDKANLGQGAKISVGKQGKLIFGKNFLLTANSTFVSHKKIEIGDDCLFSWDILIMDTDFHEIFNSNNEHINPSKEIQIGNNVWVGCRTTIIKGTQISKGIIIAADSTVFGKLDSSHCIYGGNPVGVLKNEVSWKK